MFNYRCVLSGLMSSQVKEKPPGPGPHTTHSIPHRHLLECIVQEAVVPLAFPRRLSLLINFEQAEGVPGGGRRWGESAPGGGGFDDEEDDMVAWHPGTL